MDKQTFSSIQATTNTSRYAAAVFRKGLVHLCHLLACFSPCVCFFVIVRWFLWTGELHITPLTGILQMRPSFSYLDKADGKTREREAANEGASVCHFVLCTLAIFAGCDITRV